jgi:hypothetical protein
LSHPSSASIFSREQSKCCVAEILFRQADHTVATLPRLFLFALHNVHNKETGMKKGVLSMFGAALVAIAFSGSSATALPIAPQPAAGATAGIVLAQYHGHYHVRPPRCTMRTVVTRGPYGRRIVKRVRVCR